MNRALIDTLTKDNEKWRRVALNITKDYDRAQDLVQEMYMKFSTKTYDKYEVASEYLVVLVMTNLQKTYVKKNWNLGRLSEEFDVADKVSDFEIEDDHLIYLKRFNELPMRQQELILESYDYSLREIADKFNINYVYVHRQIHKGLKHVLGDNYQDYKNSNLKFKK
jgi:RNA polymerase sigma factor (sigma-70 family)